MLEKVDNFGKQRPWIWISGWSIWAITLWILSSGNPAPKELPPIPHLDKIAHFGYFFGGGGLFCAWLIHRWPSLSCLSYLKYSALMGAVIGALDEYHQSHTPGRYGNDLGDWIADFSGAIVGAWVMYILLKKLCKNG